MEVSERLQHVKPVKVNNSCGVSIVMTEIQIKENARLTDDAISNSQKNQFYKINCKMSNKKGYIPSLLANSIMQPAPSSRYRVSVSKLMPSASEGECRRSSLSKYQQGICRNQLNIQIQKKHDGRQPNL